MSKISGFSGAGREEEVILFHDPVLNLKIIVRKIHSTQLGPALGGVRMWNYDDEINSEDALRLSKSMTYKAARRIEFGRWNGGHYGKSSH
jgi:glutamate dehydrogenase/leucine dehydrogenase